MKIYEMTTLVMDNDSATTARLRASVDPDIKKKPYINHTKKGFPGSLVELSNTHRVLKKLKVRTHIEWCFTYYVHQAEENSENMASVWERLFHIYMVRKLSNLEMNVFIGESGRQKILQLSYYFEIWDNFYDY